MNRGRAIDILAEQLERSLELFEPADRDFALEEIILACRKRRGKSNTGRYHLDFQEEEPPTKPEGSQSSMPQVTPVSDSPRPALDKLKTSVDQYQRRTSERHRLPIPRKDKT
jgi:hypothetical protein